MKNVRYVMFAMTLAVTLLLSACGAAPTPETIVVVVTATSEPVVEPPPVEPTEVVFAPVAISGPQNGATMTWLDGSTLVYIPEGDFTMGNNNGYDAPAHKVSLSSYWIQQTSVTNRMYEQCVKAGGCSAPTQQLGGPVFTNPQYASHPVVGVNWDQAQAYCTWVQGSLPTEAQWEKAARGQNGNTYPWGEAKPTCNLLNFGNCYGRTTNVDAYAAGQSPFGVLDMAGNVFEWAADWYDAQYYSQSPAENPTGPVSGQYRVIRGSSFESVEEQTISAIRRFDEQGDSRRDTGFRCVVNNPQPFAPYCQLSAQVPDNQLSSDACVLPQWSQVSQYCANGDGYGVAQISFDATWEVRGTRMSCVERVEGGVRSLVCKGPRGIESTNEVLLCNPACTNQPDVSAIAPTCDAGYTLDINTGMCVYTPTLAQPLSGGCPLGYVSIDRGGQQVCAVGIGADGSCPIGLYFDDLAGFCVPPNGETNAPFGIDNSTLAAQTYAGCAAGYSYNEGSQCCQPNAGASYPGCAAGYIFDAAKKACVPVFEEAIGGTGCAAVRINTIKCSSDEDRVCAPIESESLCVKNTFCRWNEGQDACELRPAP